MYRNHRMTLITKAFMKKMRGFSLLELLSVLFLLSMLTLSGIYGWFTMSREQQVETYSARLNTLLLKARSEALSSHKPVYICAANLKTNKDLQGCMASPPRNNALNHWADGVLLFKDKPGGRLEIYDSKEALHLLGRDAGTTRFEVSAPRFEISATGVLNQSQPVIFNISDGADACQQIILSVPFLLRSEAC